MANGNSKGFAGSVSATSIVDVLQFQHANRFSGSVVFSHQGAEAIVFLQQGEVVHAEADGVRGEAALQVLLTWPTGEFRTQANVTTLARTIDKRLEHLLLDALRRLDEARQAAPAQAAQAAPPAPRPPSPPAVALRARSVRGVTYAAVLRGGAAVNDPGPQASLLAQRGALLTSAIAGPLGQALGLGELSQAALSSSQEEQVLLLRAVDAYLAVSVAPGVELPSTEAAIRAAVGAGPGR